MKIVSLNPQNRRDINRPNQPFPLVGRLRPSFNHGKWSYTEELFPEASAKTYPNEENSFYDGCIDNPNRAAYLAYDAGEFIGQLVLRRAWNGYAFIEDICVAQNVRGRGVGSALIQTAKDWARANGLDSLALETQDTNLLACRFYIKQGFQIGGVNTLFYRNFSQPYCDEAAIFWYLLF